VPLSTWRTACRSIELISLQRSHRQNPIAGLLDLGEGAGEPFRLGRSDLGIPSGAFNPSFLFAANQNTCASHSPSSTSQSSPRNSIVVDLRSPLIVAVKVADFIPLLAGSNRTVGLLLGAASRMQSRHSSPARRVSEGMSIDTSFSISMSPAEFRQRFNFGAPRSFVRIPKYVKKPLSRSYPSAFVEFDEKTVNRSKNAIPPCDGRMSAVNIMW
jgi:hypothetical protein